MNEPTTPLSPELVDELLSAELDDKFDRAANELGLEPDHARARLAATPGVEQRRAALLQSRDAIAVAPPMDELLEQRLISKALRASEQESVSQHRLAAERRRRLWLASGGIAAAVLLVVGLALAINRNGGSQNDVASGSADTGQPPVTTNSSAGGAAAAASSVDLGDVGDPGALREKVLREMTAQDADAKSQREFANESTTVPSASQVPPASPQPGKSSTRAADEALVAPTPAACRDALTTLVPDQSPVFEGQGTFGGQPVGVFVFNRSGGGQVLLVLTADCKVVNQQFLS
jgi:hypothetical protein